LPREPRCEPDRRWPALFSHAAARATVVARTPIQVELSAEHVHGADGHPRVGYGLIAHFQDKEQAKYAVEAIPRMLEDDAHRRNALLSALGPHGVAAALPNPTRAWTQAEGLRLYCAGSTPARDAADVWIQQTTKLCCRSF